MYTKILIPLDGSKTAEKILPYARFLASGLEIPTELLGVIDIAEMASHVAAEKAHYLNGMVEESVRSSFEYLRGVATTFPSGNVKCNVEIGAAAEVVIERVKRIRQCL